MSEGPSAYSRLNPNARREHVCCECRGTIFKGERYHIFNGCWDGSWSVYKTCTECELLRADIDKDTKHVEDYCPFGELYDGLFDSESSKRVEWMTRYMGTRRKRNAPESHKGWMEKREKELLAKLEQEKLSLAG